MRNIDKWLPTKVLIDKNGQPIPNLAKIYGGSYHAIKCQLQVYNKILRKYAFGNLWDAGCGMVPYYDIYNKVTDDVFCTDVIKNDFTDSKIDLNQKVNLPDSSVNTVLLADVVNHIYNVDNLLSEIYRVLTKEGVLIIFTPFIYWINDEPFDYYRYTRFFWEKRFEDHNYMTVEFLQYGRWMDVFLDIVNKKLNRGIGFRFLKILSDIISPVGSDKPNYSFDSFPLGYAIVVKK